MKFTFLIFAAVAAFNCHSQQTKPFAVVKTFHISGAGGWDYVAIDNGRLYVSHSTQVNILREDTGDSVGVIPNTSGVHGIAFDHTSNHGFTSNGRSDNVTVFDLSTLKVITQITTGENPDAILFEPSSKTIITCNGTGKSLSIIDPASNKVISTIPVGGKPETAVSDGTGKLFVNIEDKSEIVAVDLNQKKVTQRWSLAPGESPTGLAYDNKTKRLFAGCESLLVILNAENGGIVDKLPIGAGCDGVAFDTHRSLIFTSNGEGTMNVIHEESANAYYPFGKFTTKRGARTITIDQSKNELFLPTADLQPAHNGEHPKMIPGTFQVLVIKESE